MLVSKSICSKNESLNDLELDHFHRALYIILKSFKNLKTHKRQSDNNRK